VWAAWLASWVIDPGWGLIAMFTFLLFPTGRLPSRRWLPVAWLGASLMIVHTLAAPFAPGPLSAMPRFRNPLAIELAGDVLRIEQSLGFLLLGIILAGLSSVVVRFRRAAGIERQQLKWIAYVAICGLVTLVLQILSSQVLSAAGIATMFNILVSLCFTAFPIAVGIAILRARLYDIDLVIRRTLVYSLLTLTLGLVYIGCILLLRTLVAPLVGGSELAIVASTLAIAALFNPLRKRFQAIIDKRFYRRKYDAAKVLAAFGATVRDETDLEALTTEMLRVVDETMQPEFVGLWLREPSEKVAT
jgi:hypothetical protein